jgi:putative CocE/NonD family hydrolase
MSRITRIVLLLALATGAAVQLPHAPANAIVTSLHAQGQAPSGADAIRARYTKYEYQIPMRDGVKLFTAVYVPKDVTKDAAKDAPKDAAKAEPKKEDGAKGWPIMLTRTPYSVAPYGIDSYRAGLGPSELFSRDGFIFAYQDVRGRYMSEGDWLEMTPHRAVKSGPKDVDESTDTYDTIDWLIKNIPNNNGRVGLYGTSYPGFYAAAGIIDAHPALKAASPQAPIADLFMGDDSYHNGAFMLAANFGFYSGFYPREGGPSVPQDRSRFEFGTPDGYDFYLRLGPLANADAKYFKGKNPYWSANLEHTTYNHFWKSRSILPHLKNITPAIMTVGGWFDAEDLAGPLNVYRAIEKHQAAANGGAAARTAGGSRPNTIVMGPWAHGGWGRGDGDRLGNVSFATPTSVFYREKIEFPFFAFHLKDRPLDAPMPEAYVFETGVNRWRREESWPPKDAVATTFYLRADGKLSADAPSDKGFDEFVSDPNKPVPYLGHTVLGMQRDYMTEDQRFAATRPDVLVYETEPLEADVTIAGPIKVDLQVATTGTDADWVVKVIDVYPGDYPATAPSAGAGAGGAGGGAPAGPPAANAVKMGGYQQLVRGEPFRGKFRNSFEKPEPFTPNHAAKVGFEMPDVYHTFRRGHRIMIHVQSSWFPLIDRNPQTFVDIPRATAADFRKATHRVHRSRQLPSSVTLLTVTRRAQQPQTSASH